MRVGRSPWRLQGAGWGRCGAQTACPSLRYGCPAVLGFLAPLPNFLRSLRSLWSNRGSESVHEARCACGQEPSVPRLRQFAPPLPHPAPCRTGGGYSSLRGTPSFAGPRAVRRWGAYAQPRNGGLVAARAFGALRDLTCRPLFERSERSERSELGDGPQDRVPQGTRSVAKGKHRSPSAAPPSGRHRRSSAGRYWHCSCLRAPPLESEDALRPLLDEDDDQHQNHDLGQHRARQTLEQLVQHAQAERGIDSAG